VEATVANLDLTKKLLVYETLSKLNQDFASILACCRSLDETKLFNSEHFLFYRGFIREMQSRINHEVTHGMQQAEEQDWFQFGKFRTIWEKRHDPEA
jgi:hypothetical protein